MVLLSDPGALKKLEVQTSTDELAKATVALVGQDVAEVSATAQGDGPVAAAFAALEQLTGVALTLKKFDLHSRLCR